MNKWLEKIAYMGCPDCYAPCVETKLVGQREIWTFSCGEILSKPKGHSAKQSLFFTTLFVVSGLGSMTFLLGGKYEEGIIYALITVGTIILARRVNNE